MIFKGKITGKFPFSRKFPNKMGNFTLEMGKFPGNFPEISRKFPEKMKNFPGNLKNPDLASLTLKFGEK